VGFSFALFVLYLPCLELKKGFYMLRASKIILLPVIFVTLFTCFSAHARIDIIPRKVIMDSRDRSAEVTILNMFDVPGTFRVDVLNHRQNPDGTYTVLDAPLDVHFNPSTAVRFSPRQFTLPAAGRQTIRISLRKPSELPEGEYRFHLKVLRFSDEHTPTVDQGMGIMMKMNVGVSIPVVVRHGDLSGGAKLENVKLVSAGKTESGKPELQMNVTRTGNQSSIGSLEAIWEPSGYSKTEQIGYIDNMNVFTDIPSRMAKLPLSYVPKGAGSIRLRYVDNANTGSKGTVLDELLLDR
jgi:P pilus assembly chaperone PapD